MFEICDGKDWAMIVMNVYRSMVCVYFLRVIKIVASQSDFSNSFRPLEGQRNQLEIEAEHYRQTKL